MDHIRSCLVRNGFPNVASNNNSTVSDVDGESEKLGEPSNSSDIVVTNDEAKQLILEVVTNKNTHIIEELLLRYATKAGGCRTPWTLPEEVQSALDALAPLFRFLYGDFEKTTMQEFLTTNFVLIPDDPYSRAIEWLLDRIRFTLWCLDRDFAGPNWTPKSLLELSTEQASDLASLKILGGLHHIDEEEINALLLSQPSSLDVFKGLKAIITFIHYIYKNLNSVMANSSTGNLEDVEKLLTEIKSPEFCLEIMEDLFALCFLRREHVVFEETASDSAEAGEEAAADEPDNSKTKKSCDQQACPSNSNTSPNNTSQTGNSSTSALSKGNLSFGFLCHDSDKLQVFFQMLKRHLETLDLVRSNSQSQLEELSMQRRKLDQHVSEALWRLELVVDGDWTTSYFTMRSGDSATSVRKAWIARLTPAVQLWYGGHQQIQQQVRRCNTMKTKTNKTKRNAGTTDPMLMNRLLAQPVSLMVMSMTKSRLSAAKQVADLYQLWGTPEGKELGRSLAHATAVQDLQRVVASQKTSSGSNADHGQCDIIEGLNHIRLPSAIELLLSKLEQMEDNQFKERTSIVLLADLVCSSVFSSPEMGVQLLNFVLDRAKAASLDVAQDQPWRTLRHLAECSSLELQDSSKWVSPLRSCLPFDAKLRRDRIDRLDEIDRQLRDLMVLIEKRDSIEFAATAFENLSGVLQSLQPASQKNETTFLLGMSKYLQYLRKLLPIRMQKYSVSELFQHDLATLILERLKNEMEVSDEMEASAQLIGINLPSFLARRLCSTTSEPIDLTDAKFMKLLLSYFHSRSPLLAQVVDTTLEVERGVSFLDKELKTKDSGYNMDIFRRFLQRSSRFVKQETTQTEVPLDNLPRKSRSTNLLPTTPSPVAALLSSPSPEQEESTPLGDLILEMIPSTVRSQIQLLVSSPLLLIEQLLMNCQMGLASDIVRLVRQQSESGEELNELLLRYAAKALVLGLPELPSSTTAARFKDSVKTSIKTKKKSTSFVLPAIVPSKDQWIDDAEVSLCPCCQAVEFSMFDRRHHCRRCGRVVCSHCSPHRRLVEGYGDVPVRTCVDCFNFLLERPDQTTSSSGISIRSTDKDGQILWQLSLLDSQHNFIARREFSYEHAPNLALALAMVNLCQDSGSGDLAANFLLDQSSSMLATLHRYLLHGALLDVCSDPLMMFSLIKSLILSAKMRYSEIIAAPSSAKTTSSSPGGNLPKSKPARGLARCDALLGQIDLLSLLSSANCLHLLPPQPLAQLDTWRKLRDRLIEVELWSLALDVSTKAGLDAGSVWAAWGLVCLKTGNFQGARQRFQRCLKPAKKSPLLQEIVSVLENLSIPSTNTPLTGSSKSLRRLSSSSSTINAGAQMPEILSSDSPQLITASLARLNDICNGLLCEMEEKSCTLEEILFYLDTYGEPEASFAYLVEKSCRIDLAVQRYTTSRSHSNPDVFNQGLLLPCLRSSRLEDLIVEMKRHDSSFHSWKNHFLAAAQLLETKLFWNCLYQFHCLTGDWIRAALVAIRRLFLSDLFSVETLVARTHLLEDVSSHLTQYLGRQIAQPPEGTPNDKQMPLWWPSMEVITLRKRVQLQLKVTGFLDACLKEGKLSGTLISVVQSVTQSPNIITMSSGEFQVNPSNVFLVPTLLGSRQYRCSSAVLVTCAGPESPAAFELSWRICNELRVRLDRYFRLSAFVLIRQGQVTAVIQLIQFLKARMTDQSIGFFDVDELLVECATLTQDRDKESKSPDTELVVQQIRQPACKIRAFINLGWLKAAYLLAVKNGLVADVIHIQQEATRLEQTAVLTLCDKWLRARNLAK